MTLQRVRSAALKQFAKEGYHGASLSQIALEAGIRKQSIATYYPSKEQLYLAVCEEVIEDYLAFMDEVQNNPLQLEQASVKDKLLRVLQANIGYKLKHADIHAFLNHLIHFPPEFLRVHVLQQIGRMELVSSAMYRQLFEEGMDNGEIKRRPIEEALAAYYCLIDGLSVQLMLYDSKKLKQTMERVWDIFWNGLKKEA